MIIILSYYHQAGLAASMGGDFSTPSSGGAGDDSNTNSDVEELQDRVIQLEQELIDAQEKHEEELEMEKVCCLNELFIIDLSRNYLKIEFGVSLLFPKNLTVQIDLKFVMKDKF